MRRRHEPQQHAEAVAMLAAVASESLPYTDPRAGYPAAVAYRATRNPVAVVAQRADDEATDEM